MELRPDARQLVPGAQPVPALHAAHDCGCRCRCSCHRRCFVPILAAMPALARTQDLNKARTPILALAYDADSNVLWAGLQKGIMWRCAHSARDDHRTCGDRSAPALVHSLALLPAMYGVLTVARAPSRVGAIPTLRTPAATGIVQDQTSCPCWWRMVQFSPGWTAAQCGSACYHACPAPRCTMATWRPERAPLQCCTACCKRP